MTKPKKLTIFSPETAQFSTDFRLETCFLGSKKIRSHVLILFKKGEGTFNLKDLRFNLRLNVFIANDIKNLGGIGIEEVWSKTCNQNLKRKRQVQSWSKSKTPPKKESKRQQNNLHFWNKILNKNSVAKNLRSPRFNLGVTLPINIPKQNGHKTKRVFCQFCKF